MNPKLFCLHLNECDPKKCTAIKLKKFGFIKLIKNHEKKFEKSIFLTPLTKLTLSREDRSIILKYGMIALDCSWKKLFEKQDEFYINERKLPPLIAANPVNYGKWEKLTTVEALAASLYITGFNNYADKLLSKFKWGSQFKSLNNF